MLRSMRKDFKKYSWTLWLVIIVFLLGFSFTDIFTGGSASETIVAKVGEEEISVEQYQKRLFQVLDNYKNQMKGNFNKELITQMRVPEQILQNMINSEIIQNEAKKLSLRATKSELKKMIVNFPAFQREGKFVGISEYKRYLAIFRTNAKDFEADLKKDIVNDKLKEIVTASMIVDNTTLMEIYRKENDSAEVDYVKLKINSKKSDFSTSEQELQNYFEKNKKSFKTQEKRKGNIIVLKYDDFKKDLKLSEADFHEYFRQNKEQFQIPEKTRIYRLFINYTEESREDILKRMEDLKITLNTENFESFSRLHSTDIKKENGGDWGYSEWKSFTSQEQSIIKSLKQSEISDPVDTLSGFAILFAKEKTSEMQEPYETAKPKIKNIMEREELRNMVIAKLDKAYAKVKGTDDLSAVREDKFVSIIETGYLTSGEAIKDVEQFGYLSRKFFNMNEKDISYPVEFMDGIAIVQLTSVKEPENELFENVKEKVKELVISDKQIVDAISKSESFSSSLNSLSNKDHIETYLKKYDMKLESINYKRGNELADLGKYEELDTIIFNSEEGKFSKPLRIGDNIAIIRAKTIKVSSEADFNREKTQFYKKKLEEIKNNYFISYIMGKRTKYQIGINQELYDKIRESVVARFN
ncbi:MAG: SurA N-terminal domain-containing protein [Candidatus Aminicenantes bacterium]|nr:SurA N-terminal domain-containing protein [Candidatus Aminicenantes bacterium]